MLLELIIHAIKAAADKGKENERRMLESLRQQNDAAAQAQWQQQRQAYDAQQQRRQQATGRQKPPPIAAPIRPIVKQNASTAPSGGLMSARATAVAGWATPRTLRSQFVLTEILKPPLSMRTPT